MLLKWRSEVDLPLDQHEARPQLAYLAYEMCFRGVPRLDQTAVLRTLERMRTEFPNLEDIRRQTPASFIRQVEARTALLIQAGHERVAGVLIPIYEFRHLSFQEDSCCLGNGGRIRTEIPSSRELVTLVGELADRFLARDTSGAQELANIWTEVIRLCIADCRHEDVDPCLLAVLGQEGDRPRAVIAGLCLADEPKNVSPNVATKILRAVANIADISIPDIADISEEDVSEVLERLGVSRWRQKLLEVLLERYTETPTRRLRSAAAFAFCHGCSEDRIRRSS